MSLIKKSIALSVGLQVGPTSQNKVRFEKFNHITTHTAMDIRNRIKYRNKHQGRLMYSIHTTI